MAAVWSDETKFRTMLEVETLAAEAMEAAGTIPPGVAAAIRERGAFDPDRIEAIEREVRHDVIAFLTNVAEHVGEEARFMHQGMTSSDVLDTVLAVQLTKACDLLDQGLARLLAALSARAREHQHTLCVGRTHGIHAEPTTFGLKLLRHFAAFERGRRRLAFAREEVATCAISGAVGTFATVSPEVEAHVAERMGLKVEPVSTQVIPRDRHATFFAVLAVIAGSVEDLATEIRHLQRSEVREAEEPFGKGQKGSSAMPHKRNPVLSENLCGLARLIRSAVTPALENITLWHERDISHSAVERLIAPDATIALDFALDRLATVIEGLLVYPETMRRNLDRLGGLVFSQKSLLALTQAGISREDAYRIVQQQAMLVWAEGGTLRERLAGDPQVAAHLAPGALDQVFDEAAYLRHVDLIFARVLGA